MKKLLILVFFLILFVKTVHSLKYAEGKIYIIQDEIKSELDSNVDLLKSSKLFKNGTQYVLEIHSEELDYYIISLVFKNRVKLVSLSLPKTTQLIVDKNLIIKSLGEKESYDVSIIYELIDEKKDSNYSYFFYFFFGILTILFAYFFIVLLRAKRSKKINTSFFPDKEKKIIEILLKRKKITQSELQKLLNIPKASLHRHLKNLQQRQYIEIHPYGMTNLVVLKEKEENKG